MVYKSLAESKRSRRFSLRVFALAALALALSLSGASALAGENGARTLTLNYTFPAAALTATGDGYTRVTVPGLTAVAAPGQPLLPAAAARVLIPAGMTVERVAAVAAETESLDVATRVDFNRGLGVTGVLEPVLRAEPDPAVYQSSAPVPGTLAELKLVGFHHGCRIAVVRLNPLTYRPRDNRLECARRMTLQLFLRPEDPAAKSAAWVVPPSAAALDEVRGEVDNPEALAGYPRGSEKSLQDSWEYLIVTPPAFLTAFQELATYKANKGLTVHLASTADVLAQSTGRDDAEKLRNFLRQAYLQHGTRWVVLGGDTPWTPYRGCYGNMLNVYVDPAVPCDLYFAALDGDWDANHNNLFGELADDVDFFPELHVGRISASSAVQVANQVRKIIDYEQSSPPFSALLLGERLDSTTLGEDAVENSWQEMAGIPAVRLYDSQGEWTSDQLILEHFNTNQVHLVNHSGHSNTCYNMRSECASVSRITNTVPFFVYSTGCYPGAFDRSCFAERITAGTPAGAFAVVMNSRYGWYHPNSDNASSDLFNREFMKQVFKLGRHRLGEALDASKTPFVAYLDDGTFRWTYYCLNLFGCPETELHWSQPAPQPLLSFEYPKEEFRINQHDQAPVEVSFYRNTGFPIVGGAVSGEAVAGEVAVPFDLNDEGLPPDRQAGDGVYTGLWTPNQTGPVTLRATAVVDGKTEVQAAVTGEILPYVCYRLEESEPGWINPTGAQVISTGWDYDGFQTVDIGFPFFFYGQSTERVAVSENGCLQFAGYYAGDPDPAPIPALIEPNGFLAAFWTDLCVKNGGTISRLLSGSAPNRRLVITWQDIPHMERVGQATFQAVLEETTGRIFVNYLDTVFGDPYCDHGNDAVAGLEDFAGRHGLTYSFHQPRLVNGLSLVYRPLPPGDVNGDGAADAVDAVIVANVLAGNLKGGVSPCEEPLMADFNGTGDLELMDWLTLLQRLVTQ